MKKSLILMTLLVVMSIFMVGNVYSDTTVYENSWIQGLYLKQGASAEVTISDIADPYPEGSGDQCAKFAFNKDIGWAKIGSQAYGGVVPMDLTGHTKMQFEVSANQDGVVAYFGLGAGDIYNDSCGEHTVIGDPITISSTGWTPAYVDLTGQNMSAVSNLWWMTLAGGNDGLPNANVEIYVDDVEYLGGGAGLITVTIGAGTVGVSVTGTITFGNLIYGDDKISSTNTAGDKFFTVANIGNVNEDLRLKVLDPPGWTSSTDETAGTDEYVLYAVVTSTTVAPGNIDVDDFDAEDVVTTTSQKCQDTGDAGRFDSDDSGHGVDVTWNPVYVNTRAVWIRFKAPTGGAIMTEQAIRVVVIAEKH
ncbi:hypothetical protein KAU39_01885 [bacterium]|nr:hypothetical protein [bacterium]